MFRPELRNWQSSVRDGLLEAGVDPYKGFSLVGTKALLLMVRGGGSKPSMPHAGGCTFPVSP